MEPCAIGVDIGGTKTAGGIVSAAGAIVERLTEPTPRGDAERVAQVAEQLVRALIARSAEGHQICGVGVGTGGQVEPGRGRIVGATTGLPGWQAVDLKERLSKVAGLPVGIDNDAKAAARAELTWGSARGYRVVLFLTLGTGVGGAIALNGRVLDGARGFAGHLGHVAVMLDGRTCRCGTTGCLEAYASAEAITTAARRAWLQRAHASPANAEEAIPDATAVWKAYQADSPWARPAIEDALRALGIALQSCVHVLNPDLVVIGGGLSTWGEPFRAAIAQDVLVRVMPPYRDGLTIRLAAFGPDAGLVGAAVLGFEAAGVPIRT